MELMHPELGHPTMATLALGASVFILFLVTSTFFSSLCSIPLPLSPSLSRFSLSSRCLYVVCTFFPNPTTTAVAWAPSSHLEITL